MIDVIRGLRPVDTVMFVFYLVLLGLGIVADVRNAIWFVALGLSVACAIFWFVAPPGNIVAISTSARPYRGPHVNATVAVLVVVGLVVRHIKTRRTA